MVPWFMIILAYDLAIVKLSFGEVTLSLRLLHYKNRHGLTYENRACDTRLENDINRDGRCDTAFLFCLVRLPFQNPHNCTLGDYFTGFVGGDDIHFVNINEQKQDLFDVQQRSSSLISLWFQPIIYFRFNYPKTGIGLIVEVYDVDDANNHTIHDSIDFYGRTLLDLKIYSSIETAQPQRAYLRSLFGSYTNLTVDFSLYCSINYYGKECEIYCLPNPQHYDCDSNTGQKICKHGYFGQDCVNDIQICQDHSCLNNGTCVVYLGGYLCRCQKGFTGRSCEIENMNFICNQINCIHGDCSNNGKCLCHDGWTSENCNQSLIIRQTGCSTRPCLYNSTCESLVGINSITAYRCHCQLGYTGRNCEIEMIQFISTTKPMRILINSTYLSVKNDLHDYLHWLNRNYGITKIPNRFQVSHTTPIISDKYKYTPCLSAPCLHNSTCVVQSERSFQCICSPSFIGIYCEIEQNPCESSPCQHQGVCITKPNHNVQCICRPHYTGKFCEYPVPFRFPTFNQKCSRICFNGGLCLIDESNKEQCICKSSYTGLYCEFLKKNCSNSYDPLCYINPCLSNPCLSNGTCYSIIYSKNYSCSCLENSTGERCEINLKNDLTIASLNSNSNSNNNNTMDLWPLAIVFGYVFSIMLVFIIIWFLWYGLTIRPQTSIPYGECVSDRYQPYRLGVSNPIFYTNQEYNTPISKAYSTSPTTISNFDQWTRTIIH